jgi:hypothetical protein
MNIQSKTTSNENSIVNTSSFLEKTIISKPIFFQTRRTTAVYIGASDNYCISKYNNLEYQNLDTYDKNIYGFKQNSSSIYQQGGFVSPITGFYNFSISVGLTTQTTATTCINAFLMDETGTDQLTLAGSFNTLNVPVDGSNYRTVNGATFNVVLKKDWCFYPNFTYNISDSSISYCVFSGFLVGAVDV